MNRDEAKALTINQPSEAGEMPATNEALRNILFGMGVALADLTPYTESILAAIDADRVPGVFRFAPLGEHQTSWVAERDHLRAQLAEAEQWRSQHGNAYQQVVDERDEHVRYRRLHEKQIESMISQARADAHDLHCVRTERDALRGQLAEAIKERGVQVSECQTAHGLYEKARDERDAAQARVGVVEGLLREGSLYLKDIDNEPMENDDGYVLPAFKAAFLCDLRDRIDAALAGGTAISASGGATVPLPAIAQPKPLTKGTDA